MKSEQGEYSRGAKALSRGLKNKFSANFERPLTYNRGQQADIVVQDALRVVADFGDDAGD